MYDIAFRKKAGVLHPDRDAISDLFSALDEDIDRELRARIRFALLRYLRAFRIA